MKSSFEILFLCSIFYLANSQDSTNPIVNSKTGNVIGLKDKTTSGNLSYKFLGVPYAEPPIGKLRFKDPVSKKPWRGTLDATEFPDVCVQKKYNPGSSLTIVGSEDCLYLNIYTPSLPTSNRWDPTKLKPVMFWIHGGRFTMGDSNGLTNPEFILDEDVLVVTVHYRLGPFGFLALEDNPELAGNIGLKDQQEALQWVNNNIRFFGGNPSNVILFGESSGAVSVHAHILSPRIQNIFHGAILQSGTALMGYVQYFLEKKAQRSSRKFIETINCNVSNVLKCLESKDLHTLMLLSNEITAEQSSELTNFWIVQDSSAPSPVLPYNPLQQLTRGNFKKVPLIIGNTKDDGGLFLLTDPRVKIGFEENNTETLMSALGLATANVTEEEKRIVNIMKRFYLSEGSVDDNEKNLIELATDSWFESTGAEVKKLHEKYAPVFRYILNERCTEFSYSSVFGGGSNDYGVTHADDLNCLFKPIFGSQTDSGQLTSKAFVRSFANFAKFQTPTSQNLERTWSKGELMFFESTPGKDKNVEQRENLLTRMLLWDKIFWKSMEEKLYTLKNIFFLRVQ